MSPQNYWAANDPVKIGDRVRFLSWEGAIVRFADRKRGPTIVVRFDQSFLPPGIPKYFWPDQLSRLCSKCGFSSGNDWSQCIGDCPMPMSPHYKSTTVFK